MSSGKGMRCAVLATAAFALTLAALAPTTASAAYPGADGRIAYGAQIVFENGFDIYSVNPDGTDLKALAGTSADEEAPSYSPDGEQIAFIRRADGPMMAREIWVMDADGTDQRPVLTGVPANYFIADPTFSPDGSLILYRAYDENTANTNLWIVNVSDSTHRQLTNVAPPFSVYEPAYSPDGSKIAVTYESDGNPSRIALINADGTGPVSPVSPASPASSSQPGWSPDGSRIAFRRGDDLYEMTPTGSNLTQLTDVSGVTSDNGPTYSPQGSQFVFVRQVSSSGGIRLGIPGVALGPTTSLAPGSGGSGGTVVDWQALNPPSCDVGSSKSAKSGKSVAVSISCTNENAAVTIQGSGKVAGGKKGGKGKRKAAKFTIPPVSADASIGDSTVTVTLPKKPAKAVKKGRKAKATLQITFTDGLGATSTDTAKAVFKAKRKKRGK